MHRVNRSRWFWWVLLALAGVPAMGQEKALVEWRFDQEGNDRGWKASQIGDLRVQGGALTGKATGNDPILIGPVFEIPATATACVEVCMTATEGASAELYWTETLEGRFGGFSGSKVRVFPVEGDGKEHVYRIHPFWQSVEKVVRLRFDPPSAGRFALRWIRVVDRAAGPVSQAKSWSAEEIARDWRRLGDVAEAGQGPIVASPALSIEADEHAFVCVRLATATAGTGRLYAASRQQVGWDGIPFALRADGKVHSYNIDVGSLKTWRGRVVMLGVQLPGDAAGARIESVQVSRDPEGPAELEVSYFGSADGVWRVGRAAGIALNVRNLGGRPAEAVKATLQAPAGVRILGEAARTIDRVSIYQPQTVLWRVQSDVPGKVELTARLEAAGREASTARASLEVTPVPAVAGTDYVPEPRPVQCDYELGAFYFPGWSTAARWQPIRDYPNRKPVLGFYDEANPECADWQIKWAVEHGIKFFMVDWYWSQGRRHHEHWVHSAYAKARYRKYLKWAVMWANHNAPNTHSVEDWKQVTRYWIENYFGMPEYYRIDDRPAVFMWAPTNIRRDLGGVEPSAKLYAMAQEMARAAGYKGIYFAAVNGHESAPLYGQLKAEGYEGTTNYHGFGLARRLAGSDRFCFDRVVETALETWEKEDALAKPLGMTYMPIVDTGWDARPWHAEKTIVIGGRTPELFGRLCRKARAYAGRNGRKVIAIGPVNEWGEGSYIEPYAEHGFADLDQLRAAFCAPPGGGAGWPPNVVPADVGRGPYDLAALAPKTAWEFDADGDFEGWQGNGDVADAKVQGGLLIGRSTGRDPLIDISGLRVEADRFARLTFRFRSDTRGTVQVFFANALVKMSDRTCINVEVPGDGRFHEHTVDLSGHGLWRGLITQLRVDPATQAGVNFAVDYVRLEGR